MELSAIGRQVLIAREGRRLEAYRDSVGIWTIGIGHTSAAGPPAVTPGLRLTPDECDALFTRDVARFAESVATALPAPLPEHAFDALVSLCFNIGPAAFRRSSVLRRLRAGDREGAAEAILMWNRPAVLIPRRRAEYDQFRTPYAVALPRARSNEAPVVPRLPHSGRRPIPRPTPVAPPRHPSGEPPARAGGLLARLWAKLRSRS
jgi:lysozyme